MTVWSIFNLIVPEFDTAKKLTISSSVPLAQGNEDYMNDYVDAGFNAIQMTEDYYSLSTEDGRDAYFSALKLCETLGVDVYIHGNGVLVAGSIKHQIGHLLGWERKI